MARAGTPKRRKEKENYFNHGVVGRVTGATLKDTGIRDEYGMEPIEGIFSSADKSTRSRRESNATITSSEEMEVGQSSGPEPTEVLSERRAASARNAQSASAKSRVPPPVSRSPIKTNIGATPRRYSSLGPVSSARRSSTPKPETPVTATQTHVNRLLKFGPTDPVRDPVRSVERSPSRATRQASDVPATPRRNIYSYSPDQLPDAGVNDNENDTKEVVANGTNDDTPPPQYGDDADLNIEDQEPVEEAEAQQTPPARKLAAARKSDVAILQEDVAPVEEEELEEEEEVVVVEEDDDYDATAAEPAEQISPPRSGQKRREEPPTTGELDNPDPPEPPSKRTRRSLEGKNKPKETKGTKSKAVASSQQKKALVNGDSFDRPFPTRPLQRERHETPMDDGVTRTRSGRLTFKPLNYWKGERAVTGIGALAAIQEIIRMDDVTPQKRNVGVQKKQRKKREYTVFQDEEEEGEDEEDGEAAWEKESGVISGTVKIWDPVLGPTNVDEDAEQELAFAVAKIVPREVQGGEFQFAKTLTLPFFGSGIVELPPQGFKRHKNSRKMQMCFFVHYGKVTVDVAGTVFTITKGGMWQVPRGNSYSIRNTTEHPAKIFFAQGCEVPPELRDLPI